MKRTLESFDELPPACLGGIHGLTKSINASVYLANEAHYDCNDLGIGISIWMERVQDHPTDTFIILLYLIVMDNKKQTRYGVLIKLGDGCAISWDGALKNIVPPSELHLNINSIEMLSSIPSMWFTMERIWLKWVGSEICSIKSIVWETMMELKT